MLLFFCRMLLQSRILFQLSARPNVHTCRRYIQMARAAVSGKPRAGPVKSSQYHDVFPVHEAVLSQIRCDVLVKDTYKGRIVDTKKTCKEPLKGKLNISNESHSSAARQLELLTRQELINFIQDLACSRSSGEKSDTDLNFLQTVESECCSRAKAWDSAALLLVADAFFVMRYRCSRYLSAMFREFEHRWRSLTIGREDIVQLAMCIVVGRKFPLLLVSNIEKFVDINVSEFSAGELSVICFAFFVTNTSFGNVEVMEKLANAVLCLSLIHISEPTRPY